VLSLEAVLEQSRAFGHLGPGPVSDHLRNAEAFVACLGDNTTTRLLDLGSGGGLPGLVIARAFPSTEIVLLDARERRCEFLRWAAEELDASNISVLWDRSERVAQDPSYRSSFDVVTARSFGPPAVTAENAAGFIREGGRLLVSEPPEPRVWDRQGLSLLGMTVGRLEKTGDSSIQVILQERACDPRYPRPVGVPAKRPLF
jgi:16S rRNA (guanine527-N7)-methyltransferase